MSSPALAVVICAQIVVFQLLPIPLTRSLFHVRLGPLPPSIDADIRRHLRESSRARTRLGTVLLGVAIAAGALGIPVLGAATKILLAVVSLTSSGAFIAAMIRDRRVLASFHDRLPEASRRTASLEPRRLTRWYPPAWELVPVATVLATLALVVAAGPADHAVPAGTWMLQGLQAAFVVGGLLYVVRRVPAVAPVSQRLATFRDRPEEALRFGEALLDREMRYFLLARIGVTLLLGTSVAEDVLGSAGHHAAGLARDATWILVALLVVAFAVYLRGVVRLTHRAAESVGEEKCPHV